MATTTACACRPPSRRARSCSCRCCASKPEDAQIIEYCEALAAQLGGASAFGEPIRVLVDRKSGRAIEKRWAWIKRGVPIICEIGARDVANGAVSLIRRDRTRQGEKVRFETRTRAELVGEAGALLAEIQQSLLEEAQARLKAGILSDVATLADLQAYFKDAGGAAGRDVDAEESGPFRGWALVPWSRPEGSALEPVERQLKALKITIRGGPARAAAARGEALHLHGRAGTRVRAGGAHVLRL